MTDKDHTVNYGFQIPPGDGDSYQDEDDLRIPFTQVDTSLKAVNDSLYSINHRPHLWDFPRIGVTENNTFGVSAEFAPLISGFIPDAPPGDYLIYLTLTLSGSASDNNTNIRMSAGSVNLGDPRCDVSIVTKPATYILPMMNWLGGSITVDVSARVFLGTCTVWKIGSHVSVQYLGPR